MTPGQYSYHNESVLAEDTALIINQDTISCEELPFDDPRWPKVCRCGFVFPDDTIKQTFFLEIYLTPDGKEVTTRYSKFEGIENAPPGSMWHADWMSHWRGPDGRTLVVMTPGGEWCIDGPASNGGRPWKREGTPPMITVAPSINIEGKYHGWLRNGELSDPI